MKPDQCGFAGGMSAGDRRVIAAFKAYLTAAYAAGEVAGPPGVPDEPAWFDATHPGFPWMPAPDTTLPCGCHLRAGDFDTVLCPGHLAEIGYRPGPVRPDRAGRLPGCPCGITGPHTATVPARVSIREPGCPYHGEKAPAGPCCPGAAAPAWAGTEPQETGHDDDCASRPVSAPPLTEGGAPGA